MLIIQRAWGLTKLRGGDFDGSWEISSNFLKRIRIVFVAQHYI